MPSMSLQIFQTTPCAMRYIIIPFFPCGSLQLSCRQGPQVDHWESRQCCWHWMEQYWTAEGGSSSAHSLAFTGLDTEHTKETKTWINQAQVKLRHRQLWSVCVRLCVCVWCQVIWIQSYMLDVKRMKTMKNHLYWVEKYRCNLCILVHCILYTGKGNDFKWCTLWWDSCGEINLAKL